MITNFNDFCLWIYCLVDDCWPQIAPFVRRPGPKPHCSDPELITMAIVGEANGWAQETTLVSCWQRHRDLFPVQPERSRFNRRRRQLMFAINLVRQLVTERLHLAEDNQFVIDSLPVPVVNFHLAPAASTEWDAFGATYGTVATKKEKIFGYKLHLLVTLNGVIRDFELVAANGNDREVAADLLSTGLAGVVLGDKAYISQRLKSELAGRGVVLQTIPRRNQKVQLPRALQRLHNQLRQIVETVNGQLAEQFNIERNHADSFWGLCARLYTKLAAHTLSIAINHLLGNEHILQIKRLAFPL